MESRSRARDEIDRLFANPDLTDVEAEIFADQLSMSSADFEYFNTCYRTKFLFDDSISSELLPSSAENEPPQIIVKNTAPAPQPAKAKKESLEKDILFGMFIGAAVAIAIIVSVVSAGIVPAVLGTAGAIFVGVALYLSSMTIGGLFAGLRNKFKGGENLKTAHSNEAIPSPGANRNIFRRLIQSDKQDQYEPDRAKYDAVMAFPLPDEDMDSEEIIFHFLNAPDLEDGDQATIIAPPSKRSRRK